MNEILCSKWYIWVLSLDNNFVARQPRYQIPDGFLIVPIAVYLGRVEMVDACVV